MRLGRAEKAGSGVDKIVSGWQSLGWPLPTVAEETRGIGNDGAGQSHKP